MKLFWIMIIGGILIIGSLIAYQILKPESKFNFEELLQTTLNPNTNLATINLGSSGFSQYKTTGYFYYKLLSRTGNESLYSISFRDVNKTHTIICLEVDFDNKQVTTYKDFNRIIVDENYTYTVPNTLSFYKNELKQIDLNKELVKASGISPNFEEGDINKFCYQANKEKDFYLKFGNNSVIVILEAEVVTTSLLTNVTAQTGDANFTHLNISTTAPYDKLVAYWSFDGDKENTKTTTHYDFTKENNDGIGVADTLINSTNCVYGDCLQLDGTGDYVLLTDDAIDLGTGFDYSISLWFNSNDLTNFRGIFQLVPTDWETNGFISVFSAIGIVLACPIDDVNACLQTSALSTNTWYHLVYAIGDNGNEIDLYINGQLDNNAAVGFTEPIAIETSIGRITDEGGTVYHDGEIDEIMIFVDTLTSQQVLDIYNNQSARFVGTGKQELNNQTYLNISSGNNRVNVTTTFDNLFESNLSLFLQYYESGSWSSTSAQNLTSGQNATFTIGSSSTNLTLNYTLIAGPNQTSTFYTPIVYDDIILDVYTTGEPPEDCWTEETWGTFIPNGCVYEILSGEVG